VPEELKETPSMHHARFSVRTLASVVVVALPLTLVAIGCESSSSSSPSTAPDAQVSPFDAGGASDAPATDTSVPADASPGTDAADAADAALTTTLPFATGLGAGGTVLADGQIDPHWTVKDADGAALSAYVKTDALGYEGYWMAPSATSKFLSPFVDTVDPAPAGGTFTYTTTFVLGAEVDPSKVQLVVRYASDNAMTAITVNGTAVAAVTAGSYSAFDTVTVAAPFVMGTNRVALTVANTGGPTGMRAELDLTK
jgi:hypothetical protein